MVRKSLFYSLFKLGAFPRQARATLEKEGLLIVDEGMPGLFFAQNVKGPGRKHRHRREGFSGALAISRERILCYTFGKRQIHIATNDPLLKELTMENPDYETLVISFESGVFRQGWEGKLEFRFKTGKAREFREIFAGLRQALT